MINYKSVKWSLGVALSLGLTACNTWAPMQQRPPYAEPKKYESMKSHKQDMERHAQRAQKTYASKDPTQKSTPGPVRKSAPQLPVIQ